MDTEHPNPEVAGAVDALLSAVSKSTDDFRAFYEVVSKARLAQPTPFPRVAVSTVESIIEHLRKAEVELQELLVALGLVRSHRP
jgi:hypothetical protein